MKIPKSFQLGGTTWTVELSDLIPDSLGETHQGSGKVVLNNSKLISRDQREQTYCHELVHAILYAMGKGQKEPHDEEFVDVFGTFLHQYLKTAK